MALNTFANRGGQRVPGAELDANFDNLQLQIAQIAGANLAVFQYANRAAFPPDGLPNVIYIAIDTQIQYAWSPADTDFYVLSPNPANTDFVPEGEINQYYTDAKVLNVAQAKSAKLTGFDAVTFAANKGVYATGASAFATFDFTSYMRGLMGSASVNALLTTLSVYTKAQVDTAVATRAALDLSNATVSVVPAAGVAAPFLSRLRSLIPLITDIDPNAGSGANDTASFSAAMADCAGLILPVPPGGAYNGAMSITKNFYLRGAGQSRDLILWKNYDATAPLTIAPASDVNYMDVGGFTLQNANKGLYPTTSGLVLDQGGSGHGINFATFSNMRILNFYRNFYNNDTHIEWSLFHDIQLDFAVAENIYWNITTPDRFPSLNRFSFIRSNAPGTKGMLLNFAQANPTAAWAFESCNFENCPDIPFHVTGTGVQSLALRSCYFEENTLSIAHGSTSPIKAQVLLDCEYAMGVSLSANQFYGVSSGTNGNPDYGLYCAITDKNKVGIEYSGNQFNAVATAGVYCPAGAYDGGGNVGQRTRAYVAGGVIDQSSPAFTPTLKFGGTQGGIAYVHRRANYTLNGNVATFNLYISLSSKGSSTGAATITGLPVASLSNGGVTHFPVSIIASGMVTSIAAGLSNGIVAEVTDGSTTISLYKVVSDGGAMLKTALTEADFGNFSGVEINGSYITA